MTKWFKLLAFRGTVFTTVTVPQLLDFAKANALYYPKLALS